MSSYHVVDSVAHGLESARQRTAWLTRLDDVELTTQHSPLMSPLVWDLAHIGQQEELWLLRGGDSARQGMLAADVERLYNAFEHPRAGRASLPLLTPRESRGFIADVRGRVLDGLDAQRDENPAAYFPYVMVEQHEQQHAETMTATHQLCQKDPVLGVGAALPSGRLIGHESVLVPAGPFVLGVEGTEEPWSLDNERPSHTVDLQTFRIGRVPVSNGEWQRFIDHGGYEQAHWWSKEGWRHRCQAGLDGPLFWNADGSRRRFGVVEPIPPDEPVQHVCFFEAQAYAAWAGARLPTEQEWEKACVWDPTWRSRRRWPWGEHASVYGMEQSIGDVWEWTSSPFEPWPGFSPMPYAAYSAPFFGGNFRVLRGGSWATGGHAVRPSFRNWDLPIRRQIFCGVRLAWDV